MLTRLDVKQAAAALGVGEATVLRRIRKGSIKANKLGARWKVFLPGRGCTFCEAVGVRTILAKCQSCGGSLRRS